MPVLSAAQRGGSLLFEDIQNKPVCPVPEYKELYIKWPHHVMHGLPCKKEVSTGSVNMVQECESETPEDSLMVMEAAEEEAFFVKKLVEDEEEIEDLKADEKREEEESVRLESGVDNLVEEKRTKEKKTAVKGENE